MFNAPEPILRSGERFGHTAHHRCDGSIPREMGLISVTVPVRSEHLFFSDISYSSPSIINQLLPVLADNQSLMMMVMILSHEMNH